ncbi:MAG: hypothetical protein JO166_21510 [Deltaproteobacteria bacterium]|nr:hypothetical protein [Deltaproteobacteria bacterium]
MVKSIAKIAAVAAFTVSISLMSNKVMAQMTGVYVNGRELSPTAVAQLEQCGIPVRPGNYWMNAQLTFGYVGGPALGNVTVHVSRRVQAGRRAIATLVKAADWCVTAATVLVGDTIGEPLQSHR